MDRGRFSLLLLEPGEIYFEDFSAILVTADTTILNYDIKKTEGRLKLCSKSLVFDPKDIQKPLIKIPLKDVHIIEKWKGSNRFIDGDNIMRIDCRQYIEMLEGNVIAPYKFCTDGKFIISLNYAQICNCLPQITQLMRAATLPNTEQADMIAVIVHARHAKIKFDPLWMDLYERIQFECQANKISPLVVNPGRVVLTNSRLYYQPYNNIEINPVVKINLSSIKQIFRRRFLLRHIGIEIYFNEANCKADHIYISLLNEKERNNLYDAILAQKELKLLNKDQDMMTLQWQNGVISNYEYLLYINSSGDRTVNDLTQYPVFPWILLDYASKTIDLNDRTIYRDLSKPIGALNEERAQKIAARYEEMSEPRFMYGSHYSTPGFILFYLVRLYPHYMLCLQNGRFDHPDRMFNSCQHLCKNILADMSDFKELIPEFFDIEAGGDFLRNDLGINYGYRHNGVKVGDVELPMWAESPKHFIQILRDALESDIVSEALHSWIDLIFGYKQRGEEAVKAKNLYYYLCYEGSIDLDSITDPNHRHTLEVQIMEFGQIPKQVFQVPHPKRRKPLQLLFEPHIQEENVDISRRSSFNIVDMWKQSKQLVLKTTFSSHKDKVTCVFITEDNEKVVSVGYDFKLKVFSLKQNRQIRSATIGSMPLSCCIKLPNSNTLVVGTYGNEIILYDLDFGKVTQTLTAHDDAILCLAHITKDNSLDVVSGSGDCTVCVWNGSNVNGVLKPIQYHSHTFDHNSHVTCMAFNSIDEHLAVGTEDGEIYVWHSSEYTLEQKYHPHAGRVTAIGYSRDGQKLISCSADRSFQVLDVNTGMPVYKKSFRSALNCLKWRDFLLLLGAADGSLYVWDINAVRMLMEVQAHKGAILSLDLSSDMQTIVTAGDDSDIKIWTPNLKLFS